MKEKKLKFNERIKELRIEKGLSQVKLSKELGLSDSLIGKYESNSRTPTIYTFYDLANYFNVSVDYLIGRSDF